MRYEHLHIQTCCGARADFFNFDVEVRSEYVQLIGNNVAPQGADDQEAIVFEAQVCSDAHFPTDDWAQQPLFGTPIVQEVAQVAAVT